MTITIPAFWCGVIATIVFGVVAITAYGIYITKHHKVKPPKDKE